MAKIFKIAILFLFLGALFLSRAYSYSFILEDDKISISVAEQKKIDKAEKEIQKSAEIMKEADKYYAELATKQAELSSEESDKLNNKALDKQMEALKMLQSGNNKKFDTYSNIAIEFWKRYKGNPEELGYPKAMENEARNNFKSSHGQLDDAQETKDKLLAYSKMSTASETLSKAVEGIKKAIDIYLTTKLSASPSSQTLSKTAQQTLPSSDTAQTDTSKNGNYFSPNIKAKPDIYKEVKINDASVDRFNKFIKDSFPNDYEKYIVDFSTINNGDIEAIKASWYRYMHEKYPLIPVLTDSSKTGIPASSIKTQEILKGEIRDEKSQKSKMSGNEEVQKKPSTMHEPQASSNISSSEKKIKVAQHEMKPSVSIEAKGFIFKVQVAASRVPLNQDMLNNIYSGPETTEESLEDEWYKYSINCGNDYNKACELLKNIYIKGAFISAYKDNERISVKDIFK
jgi:hypothetical protein